MNCKQGAARQVKAVIQSTFIPIPFLPPIVSEAKSRKWSFKVADLSPKNIFGNYPPQMVPTNLNIGETRVWRLDSGPNLQPCHSFVFSTISTSMAGDGTAGLSIEKADKNKTQATWWQSDDRELFEECLSRVQLTAI